MSLPIALFLVALHLFVGSVFSQTPSATPVPACPVILNPRIVGGTLAQADVLAPYMVSFLGSGDPATFFCGGTLIGARTIITAAHCPVSTNTVVYLGGLEAGRGTKVQIESVSPHNSYDAATYDNDISIVTLKQDAPAGSKFALINQDRKLPSPGSFSKAVGYGRIREGNPDNLEDGKLRSVDVPTVSSNLCSQIYNASERMLCAGREGCDACQGDSGGPLFQFDVESRAVLVGVVSFGSGCAREGFPGVYTDVVDFRGWLEGNGVRFTSGVGVQVF